MEELMEPNSASRGRGTSIRPWGLAAAALIAGAIVPAIVALALLVSVALHRPLLARAAQRRRGLSAARLTIVWAVAMVVIAVAQGAGAILGIASIATPAGFVARSGFALAVEAVALVATAVYLTAPPRRLGPGGGAVRTTKRAGCERSGVAKR
jgi:hypothetical protein